MHPAFSNKVLPVPSNKCHPWHVRLKHHEDDAPEPSAYACYSIDIILGAVESTEIIDEVIYSSFLPLLPAQVTLQDFGLFDNASSILPLIEGDKGSS